MKRLIYSMILSILFSSAYCTADTMYVTVAGAGAKNGTNWANAFGLAEFLTDFTTAAVAGDIYYIAQGTYTGAANADASARDGSSTSPIYLIGVLTDTTDPAYLADRPLFDWDDGVYTFKFGDHYIVRNLQWTTKESQGFTSGGWNVFENCKGTSTGGTTAFEALTLNGGSRAISCEFIGASSRALTLSTDGKAINCYMHDSATGVGVSGDSAVMVNCILDTCTTGFDVGSRDYCASIGNTYYTCTTGILGTDAIGFLGINNIFDECTTEANWSTENELSNWWDFNLWDASPTRTNVTAGDNKVDSAVTLTNPGSADFTLHVTNGTAAEDAALQPTTNMATVGDYKVNIGVDQDDISAGSGGGQPVVGGSVVR